jgi:hypothetical protein
MDRWGRDADGAGEGVILFDRRARQRSVKSVGWRFSRAVADARKPCSRAAEVTRLMALMREPRATFSKNGKC